MLAGLGVVVIVAAVVGGVIFKPWLVFVDTEIADEIPVAASGAPASGTSSATPVVLSSGTFISHEHDTTGAVSIIEKPYGSRILAIENLDTTTGPDVHVWLSAGEVIGGFAGWRTAGGAPHVDLGPIKGNRGNQVYQVPATTDLARFPAVVLWCVQFDVSFGAAELRPV
ncbi:DM13 domain-containing protein [Gordonia polyisoprenivorans]|uniref:DM13 domain-containing protein n=1 Tax=Gordonia polyisoprenivorans TaxID=84595 RepID=UPI001AD7D6E1|nr:DM13 domain-containing protein [Gordonia polyisoprenivorans]QTI71811.1 DM13 domain-containing protein [Gordonia polyisoprenivorans]